MCELVTSGTEPTRAAAVDWLRQQQTEDGPYRSSELRSATALDAIAMKAA